MKIETWQGGVLLSLFAAFALVVGGCSQTEAPDGRAKDGQGAAAKNQSAETDTKKGKDQSAETDTKKDDDHSGWWCAGHGIPEDECSMCSKKVKAECKKKGDWCAEHNRAKSQCFKCDPKLKEKYAALYRAKFGKEPPEMDEEE